MAKLSVSAATSHFDSLTMRNTALAELWLFLQVNFPTLFEHASMTLLSTDVCALQCKRSLTAMYVSSWLMVWQNVSPPTKVVVAEDVADVVPEVVAEVDCVVVIDVDVVRVVVLVVVCEVLVVWVVVGVDVPLVDVVCEVVPVDVTEVVTEVVADFESVVDADVVNVEVGDVQVQLSNSPAACEAISTFSAVTAPSHDWSSLRNPSMLHETVPSTDPK